MVEIFKTNVNCLLKAEEILKNFRQQFMVVEASFDLEDCDKILRVMSTGDCSDLENIILEIVALNGYNAELLGDVSPCEVPPLNVTSGNDKMTITTFLNVF